MEELITPGPLFRSVLCGVDLGASGIATRRQAAWLAGPAGAVELVPAGTLTRHGSAALAERCEGHDLLALGADHGSVTLLRDVRIPVLLARWCAPGRDLTDRILVVVSDRGDVTQVAELAARMVREHRADAVFVAAPGSSRELNRALAATSRIMLRTASVTPQVIGVPAPLELAVQETAAAESSLLVMSVGAAGWDPTLACDVGRRIGCSMLLVPASAGDLHGASLRARSTRGRRVAGLRLRNAARAAHPPLQHTTE